MTYSVSNPPALISQRVGADGGAIWIYKDGDNINTISASGYVTNAAELGMKEGDRVIFIDSDTGIATDMSVASFTNGTAAGATCSAIEPIGETSIALSSAGTGTILAGDRIVFGNGDDTEYLVTVGDTDVSDGGTLTISPALVVATAVGTTIAVQSDVLTLVGATQELTVSGAVLGAPTIIELNHATTIVAATVADATVFAGKLVVVKDTSASGTAAHTVTLTGGTWDGTNTIVTLNAPNEAIAVFFDSAGDGTIIENVGVVALS